MSLLLDALKRAEQEKLAKGGAKAPPEKPRVIAAPPTAASLELQPIASLAGPASGHAAGGAKSDAHAAQNVFAAKAAPEKDHTKLWMALAGVALLLIVGGAYVWYSITSLSPRVAASARPRPPAAPPVSGQIVPAETPAAAPSSAPFTPLAPPPAVPAGTTATPSTAEPASGAAPAKPFASQLLERRQEAAPAPFRLARTTDKPRIAPEVAAGYAELLSGDLNAARRSYAQAITANPTDLDARLGLATVEARIGNRAAAIEQYSRALDIDPRNATALAGLAAVTEFSSPDAFESQVRNDVSRYPRSAALHFTLGNLYAAQARWGEAQAEYYEAYRLEPGSADILYNLAVSLDHLGQRKLAAEHYARALEAAKQRRAQFDSTVVARRLAELRP